MSSSVNVHSQIAAKLHAKAVQYERRWLGEEPVHQDFSVSQEDIADNTAFSRSVEKPEEELEIVSEEPNRLCGLGIWSDGQADELITSLQLRQSYGASVVFFHLSALLARQNLILSTSPLSDDASNHALDASFFSSNYTQWERGGGVEVPLSSSAATSPEALPKPTDEALSSLRRAQQELEAIKSSKLFSNVVVGVICGSQRYPPKSNVESTASGADAECPICGMKKRHSLSTWWSTPEGRERIQEELQLASFLSLGAVLVPPLHPSCVCVCDRNVVTSSPPSDVWVDPSCLAKAGFPSPDKEHRNSLMAEKRNASAEVPFVTPFSQESPHERMEAGYEDAGDAEDRYVSCMAADVLHTFIQGNSHTQVWVEVELGVVRDTSRSASSSSSSSSALGGSSLPPHARSTCDASDAPAGRESGTSSSPSPSPTPLSPLVPHSSSPLWDTTWRSRRLYHYVREALLYGYDPVHYDSFRPRDIGQIPARQAHSPFLSPNPMRHQYRAASVTAQEGRDCPPMRNETLSALRPFLRWPSSFIPKEEVEGEEEENGCLNVDRTKESRSVHQRMNGDGGPIPWSWLRVSSAWLGEPVAGFEVLPSIFFPLAVAPRASAKHASSSSSTPPTSRFFCSSSSSAIPILSIGASKKPAQPSHHPEDKLEEEDTFVRDVEGLHRDFPPSAQLWGRSLPAYLSPLHFVAELLRRGAIPVLTTRPLSSAVGCRDENEAEDVSPPHPYGGCGNGGGGGDCGAPLRPPPPPVLLPSYFFPSFVRLQYLYQRLVCDMDRLPFTRYENALQLPLQPLADALSSEIYEIFERDRGKYQQYYRAMEAYVSDWCRGARFSLDPAALLGEPPHASRALPLHPSALRPHMLLKRKEGSPAAASAEDNVGKVGDDHTALSSPLTVYITILGCGRGPLITECLRACNANGVRAVIFALDKNKAAAFYTAWRWKTDASCLALLERLCHPTIPREGHPTAGQETMEPALDRTGVDPTTRFSSFPRGMKDRDEGRPFLSSSSSPSSVAESVTPSPAAVLPPHVVHVIHADGRFVFDHRSQLSLPSEFGWCDVVVSELLGSLGDNELSPECIEGFYAQLQRFWQHKRIPPNPFLVSIPASYTAWAAPVHSTKFEIALAETTTKGLTVCPPSCPDRYAAVPHQLLVSHLMQGLLLAPPQPLWTFQHVFPTTVRSMGSTTPSFFPNEGCDGEAAASAACPTARTTTPTRHPHSSSSSVSVPQDIEDGSGTPFFREACCVFRIPRDRRLSGFMGFFDAVLYDPLRPERERPFPHATNTLNGRDRESSGGCGDATRRERSFTLCTLPDGHTDGLFSWFPCVFPLPIDFPNEWFLTPAPIPAGPRTRNVWAERCISFRAQRCTNERERRVWYRWDVEEWKNGGRVSENERYRKDNAQSIGVGSRGEGSASTIHHPCMACSDMETGNEEGCDKGGQKLMVNHTGWAASVLY